MTEQIGAGTTPSVDVYCRPSTAAVVPLDAHHRRLTELSRAGVADGLDVTTWPGHVIVPSDGARAGDRSDDDRYEVVRRYREFEAWADRGGVSLEPAFCRRRYESGFTGESGVASWLPVIAIAVRAGGDLRAVYPHRDRHRDQRTVAEGIDRLADGDTTATTAAVRSADD